MKNAKLPALYPAEAQEYNVERLEYAARPQFEGCLNFKRSVACPARKNALGILGICLRL